MFYSNNQQEHENRSPAWLLNYYRVTAKPPVGRKCPACYLFGYAFGKMLRTYRVVVRIFRNILTDSVCDPTFPLH